MGKLKFVSLAPRFSWVSSSDSNDFVAVTTAFSEKPLETVTKTDQHVPDASLK